MAVRTPQAPHPPGFLPPDPRVEEPYRVTQQMAIRIAILGILAITIFCALFFRLWALQVISGDRYLEDAENNQIRSFRATAPRGSIVDRNGQVLVSNEPGTLVQIWPAALEAMPETERNAMLRRLSRLLGLPAKDVRKKVRERAESDPLTPVPVKTGVGDRRASYLMEHQADFPGIQISQTYLRNYDQGNLAAQIDGYLRGQSGIGRVYVDALGRVTSERQFSQLPEPGDNIKLTIDAELQRTAEEALEYGIRLAHENGDWAANGGALVAMSVDTGEILALASNPTFDPSVYVGNVRQKELDRLANPDANHPTLNRAISGLYPPGSTFKPFTALAALQEGMLSSSEEVPCVGKMVIDGQTFTNVNPFADYRLTLDRALAESCDTYFYDVGLRFYVRDDSPLQRWARSMGFGKPTGVDIGPEEEGLVPTPAWRRRHFESEIDKIWTSGDSVQLAIGQGDLLVTPLQMKIGRAS